MRPSHTHSTAPSVHSRPSSRNSSHNTSSAVASPSTQAKTDKLAAKASSNVNNGLSGKKASAAKKSAKSQQQADLSKPTDNSSAVPGLITLTKPMAQEMQASKQQNGSSKAKKGKEAKFAADERSSTPVKSSRSKKSKSSPKADTSEMLLSKSAPSAPLAHAQQPAQNQHSNNKAPEQAASGMTWQQELFKNASKSNADASHEGSRSRRGGKKSAQHAATKHDGNLAHPQQVQDGRDSPALTWQQELLGAKKRTGPQYDVFADARDVETFGADDGSAQGNGHAQGKAGKRRPRTGSFGSGGQQKNGKGASKGRGNDVALHIDDLFESAKADQMSKSKSAQSQRNGGAAGNHAAHLISQYPAHGAPIHIAPSTPVKKAGNSNGNQQHPAVAAAIAYAGPNFHNSPSPASLPAPKFQNRLGKNSSELDRSTMRPSSLAMGSSGESGGSDDEVEELTRGVRGTTAPAEMTSTPSKAPTPAVAPSSTVAAAESPAPKPSMQPGATVESLLARMLGGARLS
ncbi:Proline-rich nuclear receptor coactivator [Kalmanozyma brasiliensis GHG001]|nr:Proline-rich nuclear receptor coactivator [Kalmanozyma brasiliensis GHG001]EST04968.2 Proline-rich nuclear receptor coactivator [Kalmanozyma brasiliensis GHG001]